MRRVPGTRIPKVTPEGIHTLTTKQLIDIYMCGYGDRDAKLTPFVGGEPKKYIKLILEGLV